MEVINFWAVLVAAAAAMVIGSIWYSPAMFAHQWMRILGKRPEEIKGASRAMTTMTLATLVMAYVLAHFANYTNAKSVSDGLELGFWVWLGFIVTTNLSPSNFEGRPWGLYYIFITNQLVTLLVMGAILAVWR